MPGFSPIGAKPIADESALRAMSTLPDYVPPELADKVHFADIPIALPSANAPAMYGGSGSSLPNDDWTDYTGASALLPLLGPYGVIVKRGGGHHPGGTEMQAPCSLWLGATASDNYWLWTNLPASANVDAQTAIDNGYEGCNYGMFPDATAFNLHSYNGLGANPWAGPSRVVQLGHANGPWVHEFDISQTTNGYRFIVNSNPDGIDACQAPGYDQAQWLDYSGLQNAEVTIARTDYNQGWYCGSSMAGGDIQAQFVSGVTGHQARMPFNVGAYSGAVLMVDNRHHLALVYQGGDELPYGGDTRSNVHKITIYDEVAGTTTQVNVAGSIKPYYYDGQNVFPYRCTFRWIDELDCAVGIDTGHQNSIPQLEAGRGLTFLALMPPSSGDRRTNDWSMQIVDTQHWDEGAPSGSSPGIREAGDPSTSNFITMTWVPKTRSMVVEAQYGARPQIARWPTSVQGPDPDADFLAGIEPPPPDIALAATLTATSSLTASLTVGSPALTVVEKVCRDFNVHYGFKKTEISEAVLNALPITTYNGVPGSISSDQTDTGAQYDIGVAPDVGGIYMMTGDDRALNCIAMNLHALFALPYHLRDTDGSIAKPWLHPTSGVGDFSDPDSFPSFHTDSQHQDHYGYIYALIMYHSGNEEEFLFALEEMKARVSYNFFNTAVDHRQDFGYLDPQNSTMGLRGGGWSLCALFQLYHLYCICADVAPQSDGWKDWVKTCCEKNAIELEACFVLGTHNFGYGYNKLGLFLGGALNPDDFPTEGQITHYRGFMQAFMCQGVLFSALRQGLDLSTEAAASLQSIAQFAGKWIVGICGPANDPDSYDYRYSGLYDVYGGLVLTNSFTQWPDTFAELFEANIVPLGHPALGPDDHQLREDFGTSLMDGLKDRYGSNFLPALSMAVDLGIDGADLAFARYSSTYQFRACDCAYQFAITPQGTYFSDYVDAPLYEDPPAGTLSANLVATSSLTATLTVAKPLSAVLSALSSLTASLTVGQGQNVDLVATLAASSALTATLTVAKPLSATLTATSGLAAGLTRHVALRATLAASSTLTASLTRSGPRIAHFRWTTPSRRRVNWAWRSPTRH